MAKLLLNLRNVPEDEADDVRAMLREHAMDFYETPPNRWGLSMGAIWLRDNDDYPRAKALLDNYQQERARQARADYEQQRREGTQETFTTLFLRDPVKHVLYLCIVLAILYFSITPFLGLIG
ncbi:DUF6164 family protein [Aquisalimonas sp.]|uniref:DUF6164 family protein n=1 Tax=unclassified Aquisalimonas TaxID=2644645 RepID=UPI0025C5562A|nr:DUF6164 family protein [Aquisalimonas sp.]